MSPASTLLVLPKKRQEGRRYLPDERQAVTHRFKIFSQDGDYTFYLTVGLYDDGAPGEVFIKTAKRGSPLHGALDDFAIAVSYGLQFGVPLEPLCEKYIGRAYEPAGYTSNPDIAHATSPVDYVAKWLVKKFHPAPPEGNKQVSPKDP